MPKMLAIAETYYKQARVREGDVFEVDAKDVRFFEAREEARLLSTEDVIAADAVETMDTESGSPLIPSPKRPRGRPPKNKVLTPSTGGEYLTK